MTSRTGTEMQVKAESIKVKGKKNIGVLSFTFRLSPFTSRGFTLIEVMVATGVIAFGAVMIYQALFSSLNAFEYYNRSLNAGLWMQEKLWEAQEQVRLYGRDARLQPEGQAEQGKLRFSWRLASEVLDEAAGLYAVKLDVAWKQGARSVRLYRTAYALQEKT